jgi:hypothetical protein
LHHRRRGRWRGRGQTLSLLALTVLCLLYFSPDLSCLLENRLLVLWLLYFSPDLSCLLENR